MVLQIDRIEAEVMQLVPGVRYVDLETDRGRFSSYNKASKSFDEVEDISAPFPSTCALMRPLEVYSDCDNSSRATHVEVG